MTINPKRPHPFTSNHEWTECCATSCPFDHSKHQRNPREIHCRKCGITLSRAQARSDDIDVEACPIREIKQCRKCKRVMPIPVESSVSLCARCLYPNAPIYHTAKEALKAMLDI